MILSSDKQRIDRPDETVPASSLRLPAALLLTALLSGCASPGFPRPPSLHLPATVTDLTATRIGNRVELHWTAPTRTTDGLDLTTPTTVQICRDPAPDPPRPLPTPCTPAISAAGHAGASSAIDQLPPNLLTSTDPRPLLAYRIRILNSTGRSAPPSAPTLIPSGPAVEPVMNFRATQQKSGVVLEWQRDSAATVDVEVVRTLLEPEARKNGSTAKPSNTSSFSRGRKENTPAEIRFRQDQSGLTTPALGGMVDRSAMQQETYTYQAQRILNVSSAGKTFELRSESTSPITVAMRDTFPPATPKGLVSVPGSVGPRPTIDLSWEPDTETDLAGYMVYRIDLNAPGGHSIRLTTAPTPAPSYRDTAVSAGHRYEYRVTALDRSGNESPPSAPVQDSAEGR